MCFDKELLIQSLHIRYSREQIVGYRQLRKMADSMWCWWHRGFFIPARPETEQTLALLFLGSTHAHRWEYQSKDTYPRVHMGKEFNQEQRKPLWTEDDGSQGKLKWRVQSMPSRRENLKRRNPRMSVDYQFLCLLLVEEVLLYFHFPQ
jgi:hypothetical protein